MKKDETHLCRCAKKNNQKFSFTQSENERRQQKEDHFIKKFKLEVNRRQLNSKKVTQTRSNIQIYKEIMVVV